MALVRLNGKPQFDSRLPLHWKYLRSLALTGCALMLGLPAVLAAQSASFSNVNSVLPFSGLSLPLGAAVDVAGDVFVADTLNNRVLELPAGGGAQTTVGHNLQSPDAVAVDAAGDVFIADAGHGKVVEAPFGGGPQTTVAAGFPAPSGVAVDAAGDVFVADVSLGVVVEIPHGGGPWSTVGTGLIVPDALALDVKGDLFIADSGLEKIVEVPWTGSAWGPEALLGSGLVTAAGVAVDAVGDIFVTETADSVVVELPFGGGPEITVYTGGPNFLPAGVAVDGSGDIFVVDSGENRVLKLQVFSVNFAGENVCQSPHTSPIPCSETLILNYNVTTGGAFGPMKVLTQGAPNLDFTLAGGTCTGTVTKHSCTVYVTFAPTAPGLRSGAVELTNTAGHVLATTFLHGLGGAPLVAFWDSNIVTLGKNLNAPSSAAVDGLGNVYIADTDNHRVLKVPAGGGAQTTVGTGLSYPVGVAVDGAGNVYIADAGSTRLLEVLVASGNQVLIGTGLDGPTGVVVDGAGDVFVSDPKNHRVVEEPADGGPQFNVGTGLNSPEGLAVDAAGNLFVADAGLNRIVEIPANRRGQYLLGTGLSEPSGVAVDAAGDYYIADAGHGRVLEYLSGGTEITVASGLSTSLGVAVDGAGDLLVVDTGKNQVLDQYRWQPPALNFADTKVASTSSPQSVTVQNIGNVPLDFPVPGFGGNPSIGPDFTLGNSGTCPRLNSSSHSAGVLGVGADCSLLVSFAPEHEGNLSESLVLTDNSLNFNPTTQTIKLTGRGLPEYDDAIQLSFANTYLIYPGATNVTVCIAQQWQWAATGTVNLYDNGVWLTTLYLQGGGCAYWYISPGLNAGTHEISAYYFGDGYYRPGNSRPVTIIVAPVQVNLSVSCWNPSFQYGYNYTCNVTASSNAGTPWGFITYSYDGAPPASLPVGGGNVQFTIWRPQVGPHSVTIFYHHQGNFGEAGPVTEEFFVSPAQVQVQLTPSSYYQPAHDNLFLSVVVSSSSAGPPIHVGAVTFYDNGHFLAFVPVNGGGQASFTTNFLFPGQHTITADYAGGPNYADGESQATVTLTP